MENTSDSFMPGSLLFCMKSKKSVCYSVADNNKDITTTLNIYTDVTKELKRTEFDGLDKYFNNSIA